MARIILICTECGKSFKERYNRQRSVKNSLCSEDCRKSFMKKVSSITMAKTNRRYASERMIKNNPMKNEKTREKMKTTLRAMGHKPVIRGGNGTGPTIHQLALANALGWDMEIVVKTLQKREDGYPYHYKIDIGNEKLKIGIEVDGKSHNTLDRKERDKKKTLLLESLGWTILRFKNIEVENDIDKCVKTVLEAMK